MKNANLFLKAIICLAILFVFSSCENVVKISSSGEKANISYKTTISENLLKTLSTVMNLSGNSESNSETEFFFNPDEISQSLSNVGFLNPNCTQENKNELGIEFSVSKDKKDPLSSSGILKYNTKNVPYLEFSKENLTKFYNSLPFELQSYIDMFMAPSFSDETMNDDEYIELVSSVYGQEMGNEIKSSKITFIFENGTERKKSTLSILSILNILGTMRIN